MLELGVPGVIYSASGVRGKVDEGLSPQLALRVGRAFGTWLVERAGRDESERHPAAIVGMDTRGSGPALEAAVVAGLCASGVEVNRVGVCPTPTIVHALRADKFDGGVIVSGSHNPPQWNGLKCLGPDHTFLGEPDLELLAGIFKRPDAWASPRWDRWGTVRWYDPKPRYEEEVLGQVNRGAIISRGLKVVVDPGGGAGAGVTDRLLERAGAKLVTVNAEKLDDHRFPRPLEPVGDALDDLRRAVLDADAHVGFAHDCDADRVATVDEKGTVHPEDVGLALIVADRLATLASRGKRAVVVTNVASSMVFDLLAERHGAKVVRTPVGERHLATKMDELLRGSPPDLEVFGGEGSCGGVMIPAVNNARDGILAALLLVDLLARRNSPISRLVEELPRLYSTRATVAAPPHVGRSKVDELGKQLEREGKQVVRIDHDVKWVTKNEWVLLHPSNTEPIVRVIAEARTKERAAELCSEFTSRLERAGG
ncbi:MAG: phosphoglucosamine mutase [Promethearchaeota archaeon]